MSSSYLNKIAAHNHPHPEWTPHRSCPSQRQETTANGQFFHRYVTFYCCFISLLSHIFFYILIKFLFLLLLLINPTPQRFQQCAACVCRHMSSLFLSGRTEPSHVRWRRAPTCRLAVCLLFAQYERTHMRCDVTDLSIHVAETDTPAPPPYR